MEPCHHCHLRMHPGHTAEEGQVSTAMSLVKGEWSKVVTGKFRLDS